MKKVIIFCLLSFVFNAAAYCGQASKIELTDGSVVNGEIVSFLNNVYTINTSNFGEIKVKEEKVSRIESANHALAGTFNQPAVQGNNETQPQIATYGQTLMQNPENAAIVKGLTSNPELQEIAKDSAIQEAAKTGDIQALLKNPKFMNIVNSPEIQEAVKKIKQ